MQHLAYVGITSAIPARSHSFVTADEERNGDGRNHTETKHNFQGRRLSGLYPNSRGIRRSGKQII